MPQGFWGSRTPCGPPPADSQKRLFAAVQPIDPETDETAYEYFQAMQRAGKHVTWEECKAAVRRGPATEQDRERVAYAKCLAVANSGGHLAYEEALRQAGTGR